METIWFPQSNLGLLVGARHASPENAIAGDVVAWLCDFAEHRQPFDEIKHRHTLNAVGDVAEGAYD